MAIRFYQSFDTHSLGGFFRLLVCGHLQRSGGRLMQGDVFEAGRRTLEERRENNRGRVSRRSISKEGGSATWIRPGTWWCRSWKDSGLKSEFEIVKNIQRPIQGLLFRSRHRGHSYSGTENGFFLLKGFHCRVCDLCLSGVSIGQSRIEKGGDHHSARVASTSVILLSVVVIFLLSLKPHRQDSPNGKIVTTLNHTLKQELLSISWEIRS